MIINMIYITPRSYLVKQIYYLIKKYHFSLEELVDGSFYPITHFNGILLYKYLRALLKG